MRSWPGLSPRGVSGVFYLLGLAYEGIGALLLLFALLALALGEDARGFALGAGVGLVLGRLLLLKGRPQVQPGRAEILLGVALLWLTLPLLMSIPYDLAGLSFLDAWFEAMSGATTTGATVFQDFSRYGDSLYLWRSLTQWMGGLGIVALFVVVFPQLQVVGRQAFFVEATGVEKEKLTPRLRETGRALLQVYLVLTGMAFLAYALVGMPWWEALNNALTTLPAGGFSPNPQSFQNYPPLAQWMGTLFMGLAGMSFPLMARALLKGEWLAPWRDAELRAYLGLALLGGMGLALVLYTHAVYAWGDSLRHGFFQAISVVTTTGFASADFAQWPVPAQAILVVLMFIGGSAGSAAGGVKVVRWLILFAFLRREITRTLHPKAVLPVRLGERVVSDEVLRQVSVFVFLYTLLFGLGALALALLEGDFVVAFTASAQAIGNIGPGLGSVGPMGSYAELNPLSKLILILLMWAGRIELLPAILLFTPELWRRVRV